jgi:uroporphyrin-III C-methyltransferase/precorrin-2 dehydrogenase/sirohydrochlorin ferrochelatase
VTLPTKPYLSGLILADRSVVVVGGGRVASRRIPRLLEAGAVLHVIAPEVTPAINRMASRGQLSWTPRAYRIGDLADAWYVLVATADEACNRAASVEAEQNRIFCVRADRAGEATAWTPATGEVDGLLVGVLAGGNPRQASQIRDVLLDWLRRLRRVAA